MEELKLDDDEYAAALQKPVDPRQEAAIESLKNLAAKANADDPAAADIMAGLHEALLPALMAVTEAALKHGAITGENEARLTPPAEQDLLFVPAFHSHLQCPGSHRCAAFSLLP